MHIYKYILYVAIISLLFSCDYEEHRVDESEIGLLINKMTNECKVVATGEQKVLRTEELVNYPRFDTLQSRVAVLSSNGLEFTPFYTIILELDPNKMCRLRNDFGANYLNVGAFYEGTVERECELAFRKTIGMLEPEKIFDYTNVTVLNPDIRADTEDSLKLVLLNTYFINISLSVDSILLPRALIHAIESKKMLEQQSDEFQEQFLKDELERQNQIIEKVKKNLK